MHQLANFGHASYICWPYSRCRDIGNRLGNNCVYKTWLPNNRHEHRLSGASQDLMGGSGRCSARHKPCIVPIRIGAGKRTIDKSEPIPATGSLLERLFGSLLTVELGPIRLQGLAY